MAATTNYLLGAMTNSQTTLRVRATLDFPQVGVLQIESEIMRYSRATDTDILVLVRATAGTSAATHADGKPVLFLHELPTNIVFPQATTLVSPSAITSTHVDQNDIVVIATVSPDALTLTTPKPSTLTTIRKITVSHKTASTGTLTVNTIELAAGQSATFLWDGTAWVPNAVPQVPEEE